MGFFEVTMNSKRKVQENIGHLVQIYVFIFSACFEQFTFLEPAIVKVIQEYEHESHVYNFLQVYFVEERKTAGHTTAQGSEWCFLDDSVIDKQKVQWRHSVAFN